MSTPFLTSIWSCSPAVCLVNYWFLPSHSDLSLWPQPLIPAACFDPSFQSLACPMVVLSGTSTYATALHCEAGTLAFDGVCLQGMVPAANQPMQ
jgi:hypothetical protein